MRETEETLEAPRPAREELGPAAEAERALLRRAGEALRGDEWQRWLSRELRNRRPAGAAGPADDRYVRRVMAGDRPIPGWWWTVVFELLERGILGARARLERGMSVRDEVAPRAQSAAGGKEEA